MKISNEEIDLLPLSQFEGEIAVVENEDDAAAAVGEIRRHSVVGFDTETRPSFVRGVTYQVALLQISTADKSWLFRLYKIGMPQIVADLMSDASITKVGLAILDDLRGLRRRRAFNPASCVDLQTMARKQGFEDLSLKKMAARVLGIKISKRQRLTNWENATLSANQLTYAATDSWISLLLYEAFNRGELTHPRAIEAQNKARQGTVVAKQEETKETEQEK